MNRHDANLCMAGIPLVIVFVVVIIMILLAAILPGPYKPDILILRETTELGYDGNPILLVDYTVGGIATNAVFRSYQMDEYRSLINHLKAIGRLRYATRGIIE